MKKLKLALPYKLSTKEKETGAKPAVITMNYLVTVRNGLYGKGGQTLEQAKMWARFLDDCYDENGKIKDEIEISDEKFDMIKDLVSKGSVPVGWERPALIISEYLETLTVTAKVVK